MKLNAELIISKVEINVGYEGKEPVTAEISLQVGKLHPWNRERLRVSVEAPESLRDFLWLVEQKVIEKINREEVE